MALVFSAITPHPPILLPNIGKGEEKKAQRTIDAFGMLAKKLESVQPEIIILLTPHAGLYENSFTINAHTEFKSDFTQFGDLETKHAWRGAPEFAAQLAHAANVSNISAQLSSNESLNHGAAVPLSFLLQTYVGAKVLPIGFSNLDINAHIAFGKMLKDEILTSTARIALIVSGDLSHTLSESSPSGFHEYGKIFDESIIEYLQDKNTAGIVEMDPAIVEMADQCIYRSLIIACGLLQKTRWSFDLLSYEHPFGVGYLTGEFIF